ncbi:MAG: IdeS/Mac family cysteine endopeptidase [Akkermansia sp.]|nr:IdeS/Mac family cysteine endopeptidase [Akkermansia sp.]
MKKTLTLLALIAALMPMVPVNSNAESVTYWVKGVWNEETQTADGWLDANKRWGSFSDGQLCWAATCSNLVTWWQQQNAEFIPDRAPTELADVWNTYRLTFDNNGGDIGQGLRWWLDGDYGKGLGEKELKGRIGDFVHGEATLKREDGGFYKGSLWQEIVEGRDLYTISSAGFDLTDMSSSLISAISQGYGVGLSWVTPSPYTTSGTMGHAVTVWGAVYDTESGLLTALYLTDSDDDKTELTKVGIEPNTSGTMFVKSGSSKSSIESFTVLNSRLGNDINYYNILDEESGNIVMKQAVNGEGYTMSGTQTVKDIIYDGSRGIQNRLLTVEGGVSTAERLCVTGAGTNTLDVKAGSKLVVGQATGNNTLLKTGAGTLEIQQTPAGQEGTPLGILDVREGDVVNHGSLGNVEVSGKGRLVNDGTAGTLTLSDGGVAEMKRSSAAQLFTQCEIENGGVLKGSGTFGKVWVKEGGTLVVGNSPGRQTYADELIVEGGTMVFSIDDIPNSWRSEATETSYGWGSSSYSNIQMSNKGVTLNPDEIVFVLGSSLLEKSAGVNDLADALDSEFTVTLKQVFFLDGLSSVSPLLSMSYQEHLDELELRTRFELNSEEADIVANRIQAVITAKNIEFYGSDGCAIVMNATLNVGLYQAAPPVPEPATGTLALLALAALAARRRKD